MINFVKVEKDYVENDVNVIVSFSGREEWLTVRRLIESVYILEHKYRERGVRTELLKKLYDDLNELKDEIF